MENKKIVYYSEFGAVGDGVAEDFPAIVKCHEYANENGCKVMADAGARYYIGETDGQTAIVKGDVDWQDATFIINDKIIPVESKSRTANIFTLRPDRPIVIFDGESDIVKKLNAEGGIKADEIKNIGYAPGYPAMLIVYDNDSTAYLRWGCHATGKPNPQKELIVIDADGNIDPTTPFLLDYTNVTHIEECRIDDKPITVEGGTFITIANCAPPVYTSYLRGIYVSRSNATIKNIVHKVTEEGFYGAPCAGFVRWDHAHNLLLEDLTLQSHKSYNDYEYDENGRVTKRHSIMGSYDIGGIFSNLIVFRGCVQSDFYKYPEKNLAFAESERWGIMGSNYCKNFVYDNCVLSRLDAHAGVYNTTIKNSTITYIKLIGGGTALIENTKIVAPEGVNAALIELRGDYGSTWKGEIILRDCEFVNWKGDGVYLASVLWNNWPFGYTTYLPKFTIDNLKVDKPMDQIYVFNKMCSDVTEKIDQLTLNDGTNNQNPMRVDTTVTIKNNKNGYNFVATPNSYVCPKIKINEE